MEKISFRVASYALFNVINALLNTDHDKRVEVVVTMEDNEMVVIATRYQVVKGTPMECKGEAK